MKCFINIHVLARLRFFLFSKESQLCCWWVFRRCGLVIGIMISSGTQWGCVATGCSLGREQAERLVDLLKRHPASLSFLSLPSVTLYLTGEFWYLLAASQTSFEALYINEVTMLCPIFLLPINMSESILDQLCPKNLIYGCLRTFDTEPLMYYVVAVTTWLHQFSIHLHSSVRLKLPVFMASEQNLGQGQGCRSVMELLCYRFWTPPRRVMMIRVNYLNFLI